ncbi:MAG: magnesium transporter [Nitrospirae bacterium]|nr:magnesium transporter [Nitrospirota bacterium]
MPLFGELFVSEILKKPVFDPKGEEFGKVRDIIVIKGQPLPRVSALVIEKKKAQYILKWGDIAIFNKRIISAKIYAERLEQYGPSEDNLLIVRDIFDKQIVDVNGAKVVRVNDVKLEGLDSDACLIAVDVGMRGILRRFGVERNGENLARIFGKTLTHNLISWNYIQPLEPRLTSISLTVPRQIISQLHPADIAEIISNVSPKEGIALFEGLEPNAAAEALHELRPDVQVEIIDKMDKKHASGIIERMPPDEAADIISGLPTEKAQEILGLIEKEEAEYINELLGHEEDTAGGLMINEFIAYHPHITISEAIERFKKDAATMDEVYYIYVTDEQEKLQGSLSLRELLLSPPEAKLSNVMEAKLKTVTPETDEKIVAGIISKYNLLAVPVVDKDNALLGIVTVDDIVDLLLPPASRKKRRKV